MENRQDYLKQNLTEFVTKHSADVSLCGIDEIVLSYLVNILEQLGSDDEGEELFDVNEFTEMMEAYLPGFGEINSINVSQWMFELANKLNNFDKQDNSNGTADHQNTTNSPPVLVPMTTDNHSFRRRPPEDADLTHPVFRCPGNPFKDLLTRPISVPNGHANPASTSTKPVTETRTCTQSWSVEGMGQDQRSRTVSSSSSHGSERRRNLSTSSSTCSNDALYMNGDDGVEPEVEAWDPVTVDVLQEMFPRACSMEINHCLTVTNGSSEKAAQLILAREDSGQSIAEQGSKKKSKKPGSKKNSVSLLNDHGMKKSIINKYSYVDLEADKKEHKPAAPKTQEKKMIRYLDGKIVSTRGERFTEIKKEDDEKMKKTYVNLKPAKQYRFH